MFRRSLLVVLSSTLMVVSGWAGTWSSAEDARAGRSDPTRPGRWLLAGNEEQVNVPVLSSVLIGGNRRLAVIGGRVMAEGELIDGMRVRKVEADRVVLSSANGALITVHLNANTVIKEIR